MRILVLGGTGAMGVHLVQLLSANDCEITVTTRTYRESKGAIHYVQGNAQDVDFLRSLLIDHWDAIIDFMVYNTETFQSRIDYLLAATSQYVFLSSSRVYADSEHPIVEESPRLLDTSSDEDFLSTDEYSLTKARQEYLLRNSGKTNWTIIRPYITYSEERLQLGVLEKEEWLYRALHGRTIVFSSDICTKTTTLTYGLDVAKGIISIIGETEALGEAFHITVGESIAWQKALSIYADALEKYLGYPPKILLQDIHVFFRWRPTKYQVIYDRLYNRVFDNSKIAKYCNTNMFTTTESGLRECLEIFIMNPKFKSINWRAEALKDKITEERTPLCEISGMKQKVKYILFRYFPTNYLKR